MQVLLFSQPSSFALRSSEISATTDGNSWKGKRQFECDEIRLKFKLFSAFTFLLILKVIRYGCIEIWEAGSFDFVHKRLSVVLFVFFFFIAWSKKCFFSCTGQRKARFLFAQKTIWQIVSWENKTLERWEDPTDQTCQLDLPFATSFGVGLRCWFVIWVIFLIEHFFPCSLIDDPPHQTDNLLLHEVTSGFVFVVALCDQVAPCFYCFLPSGSNCFCAIDSWARSLWFDCAETWVGSTQASVQSSFVQALLACHLCWVIHNMGCKLHGVFDVCFSGM